MGARGTEDRCQFPSARPRVDRVDGRHLPGGVLRGQEEERPELDGWDGARHRASCQPRWARLLTNFECDVEEEQGRERGVFLPRCRSEPQLAQGLERRRVDVHEPVQRDLRGSLVGFGARDAGARGCAARGPCESAPGHPLLWRDDPGTLVVHERRSSRQGHNRRHWNGYAERHTERQREVLPLRHRRCGRSALPRLRRCARFVHPLGRLRLHDRIAACRRMGQCWFPACHFGDTPSVHRDLRGRQGDGGVVQGSGSDSSSPHRASNTSAATDARADVWREGPRRHFLGHATRRANRGRARRHAMRVEVASLPRAPELGALLRWNSDCPELGPDSCPLHGELFRRRGGQLQTTCDRCDRGDVDSEASLFA
mmetsp:Transcript_125044/g.335629  ORF Transcript_125044/g.335629 Transcript_125044/m.335629 type:complete len:370 (+) Transcript_125044:115-1224(+)